MIFNFLRINKKSEDTSKVSPWRKALNRARSAEKEQQLQKAVQFYEEAVAKLEESFKNTGKINPRYFEQKVSEIRFCIEVVKVKMRQKAA